MSRTCPGHARLGPDVDEFVLMTDADMLFRKPIDPVALGAARGVVVSAEYTCADES